MSGVDIFREELKVFLLSWFEVHIPALSAIAFDTVVLLWIALFAIFVHFFLHGIVRRLLTKLAKKSPQRWHQALRTNNFFQRVAFVFQGAVVQIQAGLWLEESSTLFILIKLVSDLWILFFGLRAFFSVLDGFQGFMYLRASKVNFPIRGLVQTLKLIASVFIGILAIAVLMGKSPLILFSGLGALSAVLLLVFKDPILGLVAGIQLSANKMLSVGDWLEMPKYGADGDVMEIALTTVKVRNWDKTITTIPTYALISDSFKNWRGMSDAGGRRIKRSVHLDVSSIRFLDDDALARLNKAELLIDYLDAKRETIEQANAGKEADLSIPMNGRRLTNAGTFRAYLVSYLRSHPDIHQGMTLLVRQLDPTSEGLPIQIYAFTNTTAWNAYEDIQSDIFDHIFSILPEFGLRAHEAPTGHDIRALAKMPLSA